MDIDDDSDYFDDENEKTDHNDDNTILEDLLFKDDIETINERRNSKEYKQWIDLFSNTYTKKKKNDKEAVYWTKRYLILDFMFSWFLRIQSMRNKPKKIVQFSIFLHSQGCPSKIWRFLSKLRLCLSIDKTNALLNQGSLKEIPQLHKWPKNPSFLEIGADNCAYYNTMPIVRQDKVSHFTNTINWYIKYPNIVMEQIPDGTLIFPCDYVYNTTLFRYD